MASLPSTSSSMLVSSSLLDGPSANLMRQPKMRVTPEAGTPLVTPPRLPAQRFRSPPPAIGATNGQLSSLTPFAGAATASFAAGFRQPSLTPTFQSTVQPLAGALTASSLSRSSSQSPPNSVGKSSSSLVDSAAPRMVHSLSHDQFTSVVIPVRSPQQRPRQSSVPSASSSSANNGIPIMAVTSPSARVAVRGASRSTSGSPSKLDSLPLTALPKRSPQGVTKMTLAPRTGTSAHSLIPSRVLSHSMSAPPLTNTSLPIYDTPPVMVMDASISSSSSSSSSPLNNGGHTERRNAEADENMMAVVRAAIAASPPLAAAIGVAVTSSTPYTATPVRVTGKPSPQPVYRRRSIGDDLASSTMISRSDQQRRLTGAEATRAFRSMYIAAVLPHDVQRVTEIDISVVYSSTGGPRCAWGELAIVDPVAQQQIVDSPLLRLFDGQRSSEWSSHNATIGETQPEKDFLAHLKGGRAIGLFHIGAAGNSCDILSATMEVTVIRPRSAAPIPAMIVDDDSDTHAIINDSMTNEHGRTLVTRISSLAAWRLYGTSTSPISLSPYTWSLIDCEIDNDAAFDGMHTLTITWQSHSRGLSGASPGARSWQELHVCIPRTLRPASRAGAAAINNDMINDDHNPSTTNNNSNDGDWVLLKRLHDDTNNSNGVWITTSCTLLYDDLKLCTRGTRFRLVQRVSDGGQCEIQHCSMNSSYWRLPSSTGSSVVPPPLLSSLSMASLRAGSRRTSIASINGAPTVGAVSIGNTPSTPSSSAASTNSPASRLRSHSSSDVKLAAMINNDDSNVRRLMIAGSAGVGKTTLARQIARLLNTSESSMIMMDATIVRSHIMLVVKTLAMLAMGHDIATIEAAAKSVRSATSITADLVSSVNLLWADASVQADRAHSPSLILASAQYFIDALPRLIAIDYVPTIQDQLRAYQSTLVISDTKWQMDNPSSAATSSPSQSIRVFDVPGERNRRALWNSCDDSLDVLLFVVSLADYPLPLAEDGRTNRLAESVALYQSIQSTTTARHIALVFTHMDMLSSRIALWPLHQFAGELHPSAEERVPSTSSVDDNVQYIAEFFKRRTAADKTVHQFIVSTFDDTSLQPLLTSIRTMVTSSSSSTVISTR